MYHIIVNPHSKTGKGKKYWDLLLPLLENLSTEFSVYFTRGEGHATELVRELPANASSPLHLLVLGGDGTMNEIIQGITDFENTYIGYIPTGSSNDFARDLGIFSSPEKNLTHILSVKEPISYDLGKLTILHGASRLTGKEVNADSPVEKLFCVSSDIGFGAAVCEEALHSKIKKTLNKLGLGKLTYLGIALRQIIHAPYPTLEMTIDQKETRTAKSVFLVGAFIHRFEGGGMLFAPKADATDGLFDVCLAKNLHTKRTLRILPTIFSGKHVQFPEVDMFRCKDLEVKISSPLWVHTDGEVAFKADHIRFTAFSKQIKILW